MMTEASGACEIARLPKELLSAALALTTPRDVCRAAAVSRDFHKAAGSDAVWACFLPPPGDVPSMEEPSGGPAPRSKKEEFLLLSDGDHSLLLADGLTSSWLDRETCAKCYMIPARALHISWGDTPSYWRWIRLPYYRFEAAELVYVFWFEIRGKIPGKMLSQGSAYAAYIVFKTTDQSTGLGYPPLKASVISVAGWKSSCQVSLQSYDDSEYEDGAMPYTCSVPHGWRALCRDLVLPQERGDGWMELELGVFYKDGDDGEVGFSLLQTQAHVKRGLIVQGIEIRPANR
ncbi:hypothetical protein U9M48_021534 [Paspalum notatum var. saurae]|uniref:F-box domain-containing protein n=1 Tax=Paspalum notatum var. saurae TaxID=547442 RepID=A0AAQ3TGI3_PASNO